MKGKIVHIEIPSGDTGRATEFWGKFTGWSFKNYAEGQEGAPEYHMFEGEPGGAIYPSEDKGIRVYFEADNIDAELGRSASSAARPRRRCPCRAWAGSPTRRIPTGTSSPSGSADESAPMPEGMGAQTLAG